MELIIGKLLGFVMVLTRVSAFFLTAPVFSWQSIPMITKVAMALLLTIFLSTTTVININTAEVSPAEAILLIINEAVYGLGLGLIAALVFWSVKFGGEIIEREMGLTFAEIIDPISGEGGQALSTLLEMLFILLFLSANGHQMLLLTISKSYESFPAGSIPTVAVLTEGIIKGGTTMLIAGLRLAAPMLAAFMLLVIALAVLARIAPEMDILFTSFPLKVGLGLLMTAVFIPFINGFVSEFADWMGKLLPI
jgi:flagellar biosynthetic protein FliR